MKELNKEAIKTFGEHLVEIEKKRKPVLHNEILHKIMEQIEPVDFEKLAFSQSEQLFKQFLVTANMPTPENDKNMVFINLLIGTYEIGIYRSTSRPFYHEDFLAYQLPFEYNPDLFPIVEPSKPKDSE